MSATAGKRWRHLSATLGGSADEHLPLFPESSVKDRRKMMQNLSQEQDVKGTEQDITGL